jgi:hypothetical protein
LLAIGRKPEIGSLPPWTTRRIVFGVAKLCKHDD